MTKLRIIIGDRDEKYIKKLADFISLYYSDKIELYSFTEMGLLSDFIQKNKVNGVFVGKSFIDVKQEIPANMAFAYFTEGIETEKYDNVCALIKYQSADSLIKEMIALCSEQISDLYAGKSGDGKGKVYLFESPSGGVGTTTLACACAYFMCRQEKKVLYLNMENFGTVNTLFAADGRYDFGDVIYALKSPKGSLDLKLESIVKQDISGAFFIEPCKYASDMKSMSSAELSLLLETMIGDGLYDYIIVDRNSGLDEIDFTLRRFADDIILVSDGAALANHKLEKLYQAIEVYEKNEEVLLGSKLQILYNKYSSGISRKLELDCVETLGGFPRFEHMTEKMIMEQMAAKEVFQKLL